MRKFLEFVEGQNHKRKGEKEVEVGQAESKLRNEAAEVAVTSAPDSSW
jgi:hypothetical protein